MKFSVGSCCLLHLQTVVEFTQPQAQRARFTTEGGVVPSLLYVLTYITIKSLQACAGHPVQLLQCRG